MTKKRYEEIPMQFIPKHSHQYLFKKNMMNTKYQWLNKFIISQKQQESQEAWLSKAIKIQAKETIPASEKHNSKRLLKQKMNAFTIMEGNWIEIGKNNQKSYLLSNKQTLKPETRERNRIKTEQSNKKPLDFTFQTEKVSQLNDSIKIKLNCEKKTGRIYKSRNKTLMTQYANFNTKKNLFDKENIKENDKKVRLKTCNQFQRCLTKSSIRQKLQKQPFSLTPWMLKDERTTQNDDFIFL